VLKTNNIWVEDVAEDAGLRAHAARIAAHHCNTWQASRKHAEKTGDILVGKVAERAVEQALDALHIDYVPWDLIRDDGYKKHAPLDGFFATGKRAEYIRSERFAERVRSHLDGTRFAPGVLERLSNRGVYGYEVKATRIAARHLRRAEVDPAKLLRDRFIMYPMVRAGELTCRLREKLLRRESRDKVAEHTPPYLFQAHVEELCDGNGWRVYISRFILTSDFFEAKDLDVRALVQKGKSDKAIYYALPLRRGNPLFALRAIAAPVS
jgi:hypothetical protein